MKPVQINLSRMTDKQLSDITYHCPYVAAVVKSASPELYTELFDLIASASIESAESDGKQSHASRVIDFGDDFMNK